MKKNFLCILVGMLTLMSLVSCGSDLARDILPDEAFTKSGTEKDMSSQFSPCEIDTKSLGAMLTKNIESEIVCLESNLNLFIKIVETDRPGYLSYKRLSKYILDTMDDVDEGTIHALGGVFDLSSLLFGDDSGYIKQTNIKNLTILLVEINRIFYEGDLYNLFNSTENVSFEDHNKRKSTVFRSFKELSVVFTKYFIENDNSIDLLKFLHRFESIGNDGVIDTAKTLLFLKKAILGGNREVITSYELKRAAKLFPDLSKVIFDFVNMPEATAEVYKDVDYLKIYREDILTARKDFFYADQPNEVVFNYEDIKTFVTKFFPDMSKYFQYKTSILKAKELLFKTSDEDFTAEEIMIFLDDVLFKNIDRGVHIYKYYEQNKKTLASLAPVEKEISLIRETVIDFQKESNYMFDFNRIVNNYQFYLGDRYLPEFSFDYNRNAKGVFEISFYESLVLKFFKKYGSEDKTNVFGYSLTMEQLEVLMVEFTELFEGEGFITAGRTASTAETITLMTSLFFGQSDGDEFIEVPEFTEFIISMLSALTISDATYGQIGKFCEMTKKGTYTGQCFRDNFRNLLKIKKNNKSIGDYLPELNKYVDTLEDKELDTYLTRTATFSRTCPYFANGEERKMNETDGLVTFAGIIAVEQSVLRFDKDKSGILIPEELDDAFKIYKPAVEAMVPDALKGQARKIFQYMIKYQKVPEVPELPPVTLNPRSWWRAVRAIGQTVKVGADLARFLIRSEKGRQSNADRMTFAAVLEIIAENSPATLLMLEQYPDFCERMRDK